MTTLDGMQPVVVHVGDCRCIGSPHAQGDEVQLAAEASMTLGLRANGAIAAADNDPALLESLLGRVFIEEGIVGWTFLDVEGEPEPVTMANIERLLPWPRGGSAVAERANDLYGEAVLGPLLRRSLTMPQHGPTNGSTSAIRPSRQQRRSSSRSSSRAPSETPP